MNSRRARRLLLLGFALSLVVHALVALILHPPLPRPQDQAERVSIERRRVTIAVMKTPPPRAVQPTPRPLAAPSPRAIARNSNPHSVRSAGAGSGSALPVATPAPSPAAAATAGCARANAEAAVVATPGPPEITPDVRAAGASGISLIDVRLDADGGVIDTSVSQSSGNGSLDVVAMTMAREARYAPALHDCKPVPSTYAFSVKFVAW